MRVILLGYCLTQQPPNARQRCILPGEALMKTNCWHAAAVCALCFAAPGLADDAGRLPRVDHYVQVHSTVPAISGQTTQIYVREVAEAGTVLRGGPAAGRVALFIH